jgi:hypothetical protein
MTATPDLGGWLRQQREQRSWTRNDMAGTDTQIRLTSLDTPPGPVTGT